MTKELRERFDESFPSLNFSSVEGLKNEDSIARSSMLAFIEQEIKEAERRARQEGKREGNNELIGKLCVAMPDWANSFLSHKL